MHRSIIGLVVAVALSAACGKSEEQQAAEKAAEEMREAAEALAKAGEKAGAAAATEGLEGFAKAMEGMAGALAGTGPDGKPVDPVGFRELQTALPDVSGWERDSPRGERMTSPVPFSQSEARYRKGDAEIEVKIVDSAFNQLLMAPWSMFLAAGYEKESSEGHEKAVTVNGHPGFERWNSDSRDGELNIVVAKRFLVTIEGSNIADTGVLQEFASQIDAGRLAALK